MFYDTSRPYPFQPPAPAPTYPWPPQIGYDPRVAALEAEIAVLKARLALLEGR